MKDIGFFVSELSPGPVDSPVEIIKVYELRRQSTWGRLQPDSQADFCTMFAALD